MDICALDVYATAAAEIFLLESKSCYISINKFV